MVPAMLTMSFTIAPNYAITDSLGAIIEYLILKVHLLELLKVKFTLLTPAFLSL